MRKFVAATLVAVLIVFSVPALASPLYVIADKLNGREKPSVESQVRSYFDFGDELEVVGYTDDWVEVLGGETGTVFVAEEYTTTVKPIRATRTAYLVVSPGKLNVRATPDGEAIRRIKPGTKVGVEWIVGEWARLPSGWVKTEYLEAIEDAAD